MEIKIIEEKVNALFSRREVKVEVKTEVVPSQDEAKKIITEKFSCDENVVKIRKIEGRFGAQSFIITADIYDSKEEFLRVVKKTKQEIDAEKKAEEEKLKAEIEAKAEAEKPVEEETKEEVVEEAAPEGVPSTEGSEGKEEVEEEAKEETTEAESKEEKPVEEASKDVPPIEEVGGSK